MKFFEKIKEFFLRLFSSKKLLDDGNSENVTSVPSEQIKENVQSEVADMSGSMKGGAKEYRELLELQKLYLHGKIKETDMTSDQVLALESLFDSQIENAKRKQEATKKKIFKALSEDQETMSIYLQIKNGEIDKNQLTDAQVLQIEFLYDVENNQPVEKRKAII